ncbi:hypothetical protein GCM10022234_13290 [Aeromicrobium panaciterrae]|uniref:hypothetical protein n=1 Tax=Aeromicrobium panaciterrae TaxID=363861 RepID=UPI0031D87BBF
MADDKQTPPAKKVVKRVVKKAATAPTSGAEPQLRYGRPVTTTSRPKAKAAAPVKPAKSARPRINVAGKVKGAQKAVTSRGSKAASGAVGAVRSTAQRFGEAVSDGFYRVRTWRIPHWEPLPAAIFTGMFVGLVSVGLGLASKALFNELRGVSAGGGRWGSLTFVVVAFIAFVLGELLLSGFGLAQARLMSFLGVVLTIVAMLGLFLGLADTVWALLIVPGVAALAYVIAHWLLQIAENTPDATD